MKSRKKISIFILLSLFIISSCVRKDEKFPERTRVNNFVWGGLNAYYKWQEDVPDLSDTKFNSQKELNDYVDGYNDPEEFFASLLFEYGTVDKFSWIVKDYVALENSFAGKRITSGMKIYLKEYASDSEKVYAIVYNVVPGSDADQKGIKRGDIFNIIDDTQLDRNNYKDAFGKENYTITLASGISAGNPVNGTVTHSLTKSLVNENPIQIAKTIPYGGKKIGYLLFNQFSSNYDQELNIAFQNFKNDNIDELVIDLRYNGGGSVRTATYLASMITGQFPDKVFCKQEWNKKVMDNIDNETFITNFTDEIDYGSTDEPIHSLQMTTVYFIVSNSTASASELVINGLKPHIDVKLVGAKTVGKQVGSITLYDSENYVKNGPKFNTNHTYAMQPIVLEIKNSLGENNDQGYEPEVSISEISSNMGQLGEVTEPLLARTLQYMTTGARISASQRASFPNESKEIWNNAMLQPDYQRMYINLK